jgi:hypothetical protein
MDKTGKKYSFTIEGGGSLESIDSRLRARPFCFSVPVEHFLPIHRLLSLARGGLYISEVIRTFSTSAHQNILAMPPFVFNISPHSDLPTYRRGTVDPCGNPLII